MSLSDSGNKDRQWVATAQCCVNETNASNDWTLLNKKGDPLVRTYQIPDGLLQDQWFWVVGNDFVFTRTGNSGYCASAEEAKQEVEMLLG